MTDDHVDAALYAWGSRSLTVGSLFSGIGGLDLGLQRAGLGPFAWHVESDPFCRRVLAAQWPETRIYDDVRTVSGSELGPVDVIAGGFPCQDISLAGTGSGLRGARSGLWSEYARIIRELEPRFVVIENVAALLSRGLGVVLGEMAALGYDAWWDCIPAAAVSAPHRRDRLYVVAWRVPDPERNGVRDSAERGASTARAPVSGHAVAEHVGASLVSTVADSDDRRRARERFTRGPRPTGQQEQARYELDGRSLSEWPPASDDVHAWRGVPSFAQPALCRLADGIWPAVLGSTRSAMLRALGNAVVPQVGEVIGHVVHAINDRVLRQAAATAHASGA